MWLGLDILTTDRASRAARAGSSASSWTNARASAPMRSNGSCRWPRDGGGGRTPRPRRSVAGGEGGGHPGARRRQGCRGSRARSRPASSDSASEVRVAVAFALESCGRRRGPGARSRTTSRDSPDPSTAAIASLAALMLGEVGSGGWMDRTVLHALLADPDADVVNAALAACRVAGGRGAAPGDRRPPRQPADGPARRWTRSSVCGDAALVVVDDGLRGDEHGRHVQEMLVRAGREIGTRRRSRCCAGTSSIATVRSGSR